MALPDRTRAVGAWRRAVVSVTLAFVFASLTPTADLAAQSFGSLNAVEASDATFENRVEIAWEASYVDERSFFEVRRDGELLSVLASSVRSYPDFSGDPNQAYEYCVAEVDVEGYAWEPICSTGRRIIFAPTQVEASNGQYDGYVEIRWSDRSEIETGYNISRRQAGSEGSFSLLTTTSANIDLYRDESAQAGVEYEYCVAAMNNGFESATACDTGLRGHVLPPLNVAATDGQQPDFVRISWMDQAGGGNAYRLYRRVRSAEDEPELIATTTPGATSYDDRTADSGVEYDYCVVTLTGAGLESVPTCDAGGRGILAAPVDLTATNATFDDRIVLSWSSPANTDDGFRVYRRAESSADSTLVTTTSAGATGFTDLDAQPGGTYNYCVAAFTNDGATSSARCTEGTRSEVLAPINVVASTSTYEDRVEITWESEATRAVMFKVYASGHLIRTLPATETWHSDPHLPSGSDQVYCVEAVTALDVASDRTCATGSRLMRAPTNVQATIDAYEDRVVLTWADNSQVEDGYRIYRRAVDETEFVRIATREANRTVYNDESAWAGVDFVYRVVAYDMWGESEYEEAAGRRTLEPPSSVRATRGEFETQVEISWFDNSGAEEGYRIERSVAGADDFREIDWTLPNAMTYVDTTPDFGVEYEYRVRAFDTYGQSEAASDVGFTAILPPHSVNASTSYDDRAVVTWIDASEIEDRYLIFRNSDSLDVAPANATSWTDTSAVAGITYEYCVQSAGGSARSELVCDQGGIRGSDLNEDHLLFSDPIVAGAEFGGAIDVDGEWAVVGAPEENDGAGAAYVYRLQGSEWVQVQRLSNSGAARARFGASVSVSGNLVAIGAPFEISPANPDGAVHTYRLQNGVWQRAQRLVDNTMNLQTSHWFGTSVSLDGEWLIVGVPGYIINDAPRGAISIYRFNANTNSWIGMSHMTGHTSESYFGWSVSTEDGVFIVGIPNRLDVAGPVDRGSARIILRTGSLDAPDFRVGATLISPHFLNNDHFGYSVAYSNGYAVIGAPQIRVDGSAPGAAFVYAYDEDRWPSPTFQLSNGLRLDAPFGNRIGHVVSAGPGLIAIGGETAGRAYTYRSTNNGWEQAQVITDPHGRSVPSLGSTLALGGDWLLVGASGYGAGGAVMKAPQIAAPSRVAATDGTNDRRIDINWIDESQNEDGFRIYRNGRLIATTGANARSYQDTDAPAGAGHEYCIAAYSELLGESGRICDYGWRPPDGAMNGRIATYAGAGVDGVDICLDPAPGRSLLTDGDGGALRILHGNDGAFDLGNTLTIEGWIKPTDLSRRHDIFSTRRSNRPGSFRLEVGTGNGGVNRVSVAGINTWVVATGDNAIRPNEWTHIAYVRSGEADDAHAIYINGVRQAITTTPYVFLDNADEKSVAGSNFKGQIDQLRVWSVARSEAQINANMSTALFGEIEGLAANWSFDILADNAVMDLTANGRHGLLVNGAYTSSDAAPIAVCAVTDLEGNYSLPNVQYGSSTTFRVTPSLGARRFEPAHKSITLGPENPIQNEISFTDASSFTLTGTVQYDGFACFPEGVEILVDGEVRGTTDNRGRFSIAAEVGSRVIEARFQNHAFSPSRLEMNVEGDAAGIEFINTTLHTLSGRVGGGCSLSIGTADVEIFTENECFRETIQIDGSYQVKLPPMPYLVRVPDVATAPGIDKADVLRFFENMGAREIDLTDDDLEFDLTYRAPLLVEIEGMPDTSCPNLHVNSRPLPSVPVLEQGPTPIPLLVRVTEDYGSNGLCPVDTGRVTIYDEIVDEADAPVTLEIVDGQVVYETFANTPNVASGRKDALGIDRSYQKSLTAIAEVPDKEAVSEVVWAVVTGDRTRAGTFVSATSEEIPLLILRDPPGDQSFSYLEEGTQICNTISNMGFEKVGGGIEAEVQVGIEFFKGLGIMSRTQAAVIGGTKFEMGVEATQEGAMEICATTTERFSTSGDPQFVGEDADVFLGTAMNFVFAKADRLEVDGCNIVLSESLRMGADGFETTYLYTQAHIRDAIIPQLDDLARLNEDQRNYFLSSREIWQRHLDLNRQQKLDANPVRNRSFSAGADYDFSHTVDTTSTNAWDVKVYTDSETALGLSFNESGNEGSVKFFANLAFAYTRSESEDVTESRTVGYTLSDDDAGDYFTVDVREDPNYGTPVFELIDGRSSCPFEPGTQPRDAPEINISPAALLDVDPEQPATFTLGLTNMSDSEETRDYVLVPLQTQNPGGAVLKAGGNAFAQGQSYTIGPNQTQEVTMTVERGPNRFSYDSLAVMLRSSCDSSIADTLYFSVRYTAPCSDITLFRPQSGWTYTQDDFAQGKPLEIILDEFMLEEPDAILVKSIGAEYRRKGTAEWLPIGEVDAKELRAGRSHSLMWDVIGRGVPNGTYEIRAYTRCDAGRNFSLIAEGTIDTEPPVVLGNPRPSDGVLTFGEDIAIIFNEPIRCSVLTPANTALVDAETGDAVPMRAVCSGATLVLTPTGSGMSALEGRELKAIVTGVRDQVDNVMEGSVEWTFVVRQSQFTWETLVDAVEVPFRNPGSIEQTIVNGTSDLRTYEVSEHPAWLVPDVTSGSLPPAGRETITFAIQDDLPIGSYEGRVTAASDDGNAVFDVTVDVVCQAPVWEIDAARFELSMTLVARPFVDGAPAEPGTRIAAFVGNQLRGTGVVEAVGSFGSLAFLTLHSNRDRGETMRFEVYNPEDCILYPATSERYGFIADQTRGSTAAPMPLTAQAQLLASTQSIALREGWTWFSTNLSSTDMSVGNVLANTTPSDGDVVKTHTTFQQFDLAAGWVGSLQQIDNARSYMVRLSEAGSILHEGDPIDPVTVSIELSDRWNWIGFTPATALSLEAALEDLEASDEDLIKSQTAFAQYVSGGRDAGWYGNLRTLEPGRGYKLYLADAPEEPFHYPTAAPEGAGKTLAAGQAMATAAPADSVEAVELPDQWQLIPELYPGNMTITASVVGGDLRLDDVLVGAFVGDEIRGIGRPETLPGREGTFVFLVIHGEEEGAGAEVRFRLLDRSAGEELELLEPMTFAEDLMVGSIAEPFRFDVEAAVRAATIPIEFGLDANFPNPFHHSTTIRYGVPQDAHVTIVVFDMLGREVMKLVDDKKTAGLHEVSVDGRRLASGVYFYRMMADSYNESRRMVIVR